MAAMHPQHNSVTDWLRPSSSSIMEHISNNNHIINTSSEEAPPPISTGNNTITATPSDRERNAASSAAPWTEDPAQMTCDVLCSLSKSINAAGNSNTTACINHNDHNNHDDDDGMESMGSADRDKLRGKGCPKQHQLPLFLSKTYHMIDRCDPAIATWASGGDNFVVKNVEKFASTVLPKYFKHSNFSSFARQLNFYGFRKLRTDPIINTDVDPRTACHVRFYHEHFQRDRPELLHHIKRATKSDQQSKDDVDTLRMEIMKLKDCITGITADFDRKLAEMSYEYNRRITSMSAEFDKLAVMVQQQVLAAHHHQNHNNDGNSSNPPPAPPSHLSDTMMHSLSQVAALSLQGHHHHHTPHHLRPPTLAQLSSLTQQAAAAAAAAVAASNSYNNSNNNHSGGGLNHNSSIGEKRYADSEGLNGPATNRQRNG